MSVLICQCVATGDQMLIGNKDKNVIYLFMFYFFINFNGYNLFMMIVTSVIKLISLII
jgi:hypothetical protein